MCSTGTPLVERYQSDTRGWSCHPLMGPRTTNDSTFDTRARHEASIVFPPLVRANLAVLYQAHNHSSVSHATS